MGIDLSTEYLGLRLSNPVVVAACPLTGDLTMLERLEAAGAAAAVILDRFGESAIDDRAVNALSLRRNLLG